MDRKHWITILLTAAVSALVAMGCSDDGTISTSSSGSGSSSGGGAGGGGNGGAGGGMAVDPGHSGHAFVNAGTVVTSPGYKMVFTLGQSSPAQATVTSPGYSLRGGLIGATSGK